MTDGPEPLGGSGLTGCGIAAEAGSKLSAGGGEAASLRSLVGIRSWRRWTRSSFLARLPVTMALLGLVLAGQHATGSVATGAKLAGVTTFVAGLAGPIRGRMLDRKELRQGLQRSCLFSGFVLAALAAVVWLKATVWILYVLCAMEGWWVAGVWGGFRALLVAAVPFQHLRRAHFVESLMIEVTYLIGPLIVTGIALLTGAVGVLVAMALVSFLAWLSLLRVGKLHPQAIVYSHLLRSRGDLRVLCVLSFLTGLSFGLVENNVPQRMHMYGLQAATAGLFLTCLSIGSVTGGVFVSIRPIARRRPVRTAAILYLVFACLVVPSTFAPTAASFAVLLLVASLMLVPLNGLGTAELEARIGKEQRAEAFAYFMAAMMIGGGLSSILNGVLVTVIGAQHVPLIAIGLFVCLGGSLGAFSIRMRRAVRRTADAPVAAERS